MAQIQFASDDTTKWGQGWGRGTDGVKTVSGSTTDSFTRTTCTGTSGAFSVVVGSNTGLVIGQLVLIHQTQTAAGGGTWQLNYIVGISGTTITLLYALVATFVAITQFQVMPQYSAVNISAGFNVSAWNLTTGGILAFFCNGTTSVTAGAINANAGGFVGGSGSTGAGGNPATQGDSDTGVGAAHSTSRNGSGGGGGNDNTANGTGGSLATDITLKTKANFGGGGGGNGDSGGAAGTGGGGIFIFTRILSLTGGSVDAGGSQSTGGGGGGGPIVIKTAQFSGGTIGSNILVSLGGTGTASGNKGGGGGAGTNASGGQAGANGSGNTGGNGGTGQITLYAPGATPAGTSNPTFNFISDNTLVTGFFGGMT